MSALRALLEAAEGALERGDDELLVECLEYLEREVAARRVAILQRRSDEIRESLRGYL